MPRVSGYFQRDGIQISYFQNVLDVVQVVMSVSVGVVVPVSLSCSIFLSPSPFTSRNDRLFCLGALTGYLFELPQVLHRIVKTSAHGFLPPLLAFSTDEVQVWPSICTVSQNLHAVCLSCEPIRICAFWDTALRFDIMCRDICCVARFDVADALCSSLFEGDFEEAS